jgi:hypothetical protein
MEQHKIEISSYVKSVNGEHKGQIFRVSNIADSHSIIEAINIIGERKILHTSDIIMANSEEVIEYENSLHKGT